MFGFLSTEDASAPGNYGMLDQVSKYSSIKPCFERKGSKLLCDGITSKPLVA
jgi:hypothetical protein